MRDSDRGAVHELMTKRELAAYLRLSERWIELHQKNDGFPVERLGRAVRYRLSRVEAWIRDSARA